MKRCAQTQKVKVGNITLPEATADCECFLPQRSKIKAPTDLLRSRDGHHAVTLLVEGSILTLGQRRALCDY